NGRIGLDEVFIIQPHVRATASRADDAGGHGLTDAEWIAERQHDIPHFYFVTIGHRHGRQVLGVNFDYGHIALGIAADYFRGKVTSILKRNFDFICAIHDVVIGQDITIFSNDYARTDTFLARNVVAMHTAAAIQARDLIAKEMAEEIV